MWAQPKAGPSFLWPRASPAPPPQPGSPEPVARFGRLAPGGCSPGLLGDTWPPGMSRPLGRSKPLWRGPARTGPPAHPQLPAPGKRSHDLPSPAERGARFGEGARLAEGRPQRHAFPGERRGAGRAGARTTRARLRPLFRPRAGGLGRAAANSRRRPEPGARPERGAGCGAAACPAPLARARPPCPASTTSSWRSPSGGCCARCAGSPCGSPCRSPPAATASATPACRSSSGAAGRADGRSVGGRAGGGSAPRRAGLCLRRAR